MTVSVCIPTYNSAKYLRGCIESVLAQTFSDFELIVCDNGSSDSTCEIARSFSDPRIQLLRVELFLGMAGNFNHAAGQARGKYVKFLCYDDLLEPSCLEKQVRMLEQNPALTLVTSGLHFMNETGERVGGVTWCRREVALRDVDVIAANLVYGNVIGIPSAVLIRRECLLKAGPFSEAFPQMMDVELYLRLVQQGPAGYLPDRLCAWRLHPASTTETNRKAGIVRRDMLVMTESMLRSVSPSWWVQRVAWGRVVGSFLSQAAAGLRHGYLRWPLAAILKAFSMDPCFFGLGVFLTFIRTGFFGLAAESDRRLYVRSGRTLRERL
jgi:glycosyltransferase involved in cell wall biosynthesis